MKLTMIENEAVDAGYCRCPNNPQRWYAAGPGVPEAVQPFQVNIRPADDRPVVLTCSVYGEPTRRVDVAKFETFADYLHWCETRSTVSGPGLPAYYNSDI